MPNCKKCGTKMENDMRFCPSCGEPNPAAGKKAFKAWWVIVPAGVVLIGIAIFLAIFLGGKKEKPKEEKADVETETVEETAPEEVAEPEIEAPAAEETEPVAEEPTSMFVERKVKITSATASSYLQTKSQDEQTYEPDHLIDGFYMTAWIEGKDDLGIGETITLQFGRTERITRMMIYNGFLNTKYRYAINGKVTRLQADFDDGTSKTFDVKTMSVPEEKETFEPYAMEPTELVLDTPITASSVTLTILDAEAGSKYKDVAISEIELYREVEVPALSSDMKKKIAQTYIDAINACKPNEYGEEYTRFALANIASSGIPQLIMLNPDEYEEDFNSGFIKMYSVDDNGDLVELHNRTWMDLSKKLSEEYGVEDYYDFDTEWPLGGSGRNGFLYYEYQDLIKYIGYDLVYYIEEYFTLKGNEFCQIAGYDHEEEQGDTPPAFYIYRVDENGERIEGAHNLTYDDATNESKQFEGEGDPVDFSGWYETNCLTYQSKQEMIDYLESWSNGGGMAMASSTGDWKSAYRQCLNDLLSEKTGIDYGQDGFFGADLDNAYFTLQDITDDGVPELLINPEDYFWAAYTINNGSCERMFWSSFVTFYDSDKKLIYVEGYSEEMEKSYTVYTPEDAKMGERTYGYYEEYEPEDPANPYFYYDGEQINIISKQEWDAFMKTYNADMKKYGFKKDWKLTPANIEKYLQ